MLDLVDDDEKSTFITGTWWNDPDSTTAIILDKFNSVGNQLFSVRYIDTTLSQYNKGLTSWGVGVAVDEKYAYVAGAVRKGEQIDSTMVAKALVFDKSTGELLYDMTIEDQEFCVANLIFPTPDGFILNGISRNHLNTSTEVFTGRYRLPQISIAEDPVLESDVLIGPIPCFDQITIDRIDLQSFHSIQIISLPE